MIRVGRRKYKGSSYEDPSYPNFLPIICMTASTEYGSLSPYSLTDEKGRFLENIWQFAKLYDYVPSSTQTYSRYDKTVIWSHPEEKHINNDVPTQEYWIWREKGMTNPYPVRYPVGYTHRSQCKCSLFDIGDNFYVELDYIEARKKIYLPEYEKAVVKEEKFTKLLKLLQQGKNLLIIEVDGPHQESVSYYKEKYGVSDNFINRDSVLATEHNLEILLNDPKHPFGHGYCLAWALLHSLNKAKESRYLQLHEAYYSLFPQRSVDITNSDNMKHMAKHAPELFTLLHNYDPQKFLKHT